MLRKLLVEGKLAGLIIANLYIGFAARTANVDCNHLGGLLVHKRLCLVVVRKNSK